MTQKKVNQYRCDFCGKKGYSPGHMKKHEERCTKNPNRVCGMCNLTEEDQPSMQSLLAILPDPEQFKEYSGDDEREYVSMNDGKLEKAVEDIMPKLRELTGNCPACIMAALRQKGIPVPAIHCFDYPKERAAFLASVNESNWDGGGLYPLE
jgi:hypothetical protein